MKKAVRITYLRALGSQADLVDFDVLEFRNQTEFRVQLHFNDLFFVSTTSYSFGDFDKLSVRLSNETVFIDPITSTPLQLDTELPAFEVPKQLPSSLIGTMQSVALVV